MATDDVCRHLRPWPVLIHIEYESIEDGVRHVIDEDVRLGQNTSNVIDQRDNAASSAS